MAVPLCLLLPYEGLWPHSGGTEGSNQSGRQLVQRSHLAVCSICRGSIHATLTPSPYSLESGGGCRGRLWETASQPHPPPALRTVHTVLGAG